MLHYFAVVIIDIGLRPAVAAEVMDAGTPLPMEYCETELLLLPIFAT
jgi:hypothetical protein